MDAIAKHDVKIERATDKDISTDQPLSFGNYLSLKLSSEEKESTAKIVLRRVNEIIENQDRKEMVQLVEGWRNQYLGLVEETSFPFAGCFNLDMRLTPKIQDAVVAQTQEAFDDADPHWAVGPTPNKEVMLVREKQERILDYYDDTEMRNNEDLEAIRHDAYLFGLGWEAVMFERKFIRVRGFEEYTSMEKFIKDYPNDYQKHTSILQDLNNNTPVKIKVEYNQEWRRAPRRKHAEFEDVICPVDAKGVEGVNAAEIKGRRVMMKWHEIKLLEDEGDYEPGVSERLKYKSETSSNGELVPDPEYLKKSYETFEMQYYMELEINGKKRRVLTMWNIEKEHCVPLRAIRYPYDHARSYLIPHCIKYTNDGLFQDGMGRMLGDIHLAANATLNHVLNASVIANSLSLKARQGTGAAKAVYEHRWYPGSVMELTNTDDVQQFQFGTPNLMSLINLFTIIEKFGQDVSGIVNYQLGVESPDDPEAPASKTIALMRKAEIKLRRYIKNLKRSEDEAGYQALRLIYQFVPVSKLSSILGEDVKDTKDFLQPAIRVVTNASGFAIEKMFEKRDDMVMAKTLLNEPLVAGDPERRVQLWHTLAKSQGSNWDKKIMGIVPTVEEIQRKKEEQRKKKEAKKMEAVKAATQGVLQQGGSDEEAMGAGRTAGKRFDTMLERSQVEAQQDQKKGGKK